MYPCFIAVIKYGYICFISEINDEKQPYMNGMVTEPFYRVNLFSTTRV